jgi:hypothetical protein
MLRLLAIGVASLAFAQNTGDYQYNGVKCCEPTLGSCTMGLPMCRDLACATGICDSPLPSKPPGLPDCCDPARYTCSLIANVPICPTPSITPKYACCDPTRTNCASTDRICPSALPSSDKVPIDTSTPSDRPPPPADSAKPSEKPTQPPAESAKPSDRPQPPADSAKPSDKPTQPPADSAKPSDRPQPPVESAKPSEKPTQPPAESAKPSDRPQPPADSAKPSEKPSDRPQPPADSAKPSEKPSDRPSNGPPVDSAKSSEKPSQKPYFSAWPSPRPVSYISKLPSPKPGYSQRPTVLPLPTRFVDLPFSPAPSRWPQRSPLTTLPIGRPPVIMSQISLLGANSILISRNDKLQELQTNLACTLHMPLENVQINNISYIKGVLNTLIDFDRTVPALQSGGVVLCLQYDASPLPMPSQRRLGAVDERIVVDYAVIDPSDDILNLDVSAFISVMQSSPSLNGFSASIGGTNVVASTIAAPADTQSPAGTAIVDDPAPAWKIALGASIGGAFVVAAAIIAYKFSARKRPQQITSTHNVVNVVQTHIPYEPSDTPKPSLILAERSIYNPLQSRV